MNTSPQILALFSGGLDSILAARLIAEQGLSVLCVHFTSPFFGKASRLPYWEKEYQLQIEAFDISDSFIDMLHKGPKNGYGKVFNPCVDCKILMMQEARERMLALGAKGLVSGEVVGQRPMSQRRDSLNVIAREGDVPFLIRPLCAKHLKPTELELSGLIDRERLGSISGRGRNEQMLMAKRMGITDIPSSSGGCLLTEKDHAKRYWPLLEESVKGQKKAKAKDYHLANIGRQYWADGHWIAMGRNSEDNAALEAQVQENDMLMRVNGFPSPLVLMRPFMRDFTKEALFEAAVFLASYSPKAVASGKAVSVGLMCNGRQEELTVMPSRQTALPWAEACADGMRQGVRLWNQSLAG